MWMDEPGERERVERYRQAEKEEQRRRRREEGGNLWYWFAVFCWALACLGFVYLVWVTRK